MDFFYAIILTLLIVCVLQLTLKLKVMFNIKSNTGKLQLKYVGIRIFDFDISIKSQCLKLVSKSGKAKYLPIELNQQSLQEYADFQTILFKKTYFKTLAIYFNFGIKSNAFASAMVCGYVDIICKMLYAIFKTKKSEAQAKLKIYPSFKNDVIKFGFKAKISLSIYDLIWSFSEAMIAKQLKSKGKKGV